MPVESFYVWPSGKNKGKRRYICNPCENAYQREYRAKNRARLRVRYIARNQDHRRRCLVAYSEDPPKCACCGETTIEFLALDHIDGNGRKHRAEVGHGSQFYYWLIRNDFPAMFQVLCHNCNAAKQYYGGCPHQRSRTFV